MVVPRSSVSRVRISSHALVAHHASRAERKSRRRMFAKIVIFARESLRERSRAAGLLQPPIHEHRHALAAKRRIIRLAQYAMPSITLKHHQSIRHRRTRGNFTRHNRIQRPRLDCIARLRKNNRRTAARLDVRDTRDYRVRASRRLPDHAHVAIRVIHLGRFVPGDVLNPPFGTRASFEVCVGSTRIVSRTLETNARARASARTDVVTKPITARQARDVRLDGVLWRRHCRHRHPERAREHRAGVDIIVDIVGARVVARIDGVNVPAHILAQRIERARAQHVIERHIHARARFVRLRTLSRECVGVRARTAAAFARECVRTNAVPHSLARGIVDADVDVATAARRRRRRRRASASRASSSTARDDDQGENRRGEALGAKV